MANLKYFNLWNNQECSYFRKQEEIVFLLHITSIKLWTQGEAPQINVFTVIEPLLLLIFLDFLMIFFSVW